MLTVLYRDYMYLPYNTYFSKKRQTTQDEIMSSLGLDINKRNSTSERTNIFFMAGCMGAGKSHWLRNKRKDEVDDFNKYVIIDPDQIKEEIPEYSNYIKIDHTKAATEVHSESCMIMDLMMLWCLDNNVPVVIDGSMKDYDAHKKLFQWIRSTYPNYNIGIIYVKTNKTLEELYKRVSDRNELQTRYLPKEVFEDSFKKVPISVEKLKTEVDTYIELP